MKQFFKKTWVYIKTYWYIGVILVIAIISLLLGKNKDVRKIFDLVRNERERGKKEIEIIKKSSEQQIEEIESNIKKYKDKKEKLTEEEEKDLEELQTKKEKMTKEMADSIKESPSTVLSRIAKEMGWDYEH